MKTRCHAANCRRFALSLLATVVALTAIACGGGYGGGGGGGNGTPPYITTQPIDQTVTAGQTATFSVVASGTAPLSYQWQKNNANITGATASSYTTQPTTTSDSGSIFQVAVSNSAGTATSSAATLTVTSSTTSTGWTWVQDSPIIFCSNPNLSSCNITTGNMAPTVAGSVWVIQVQTPNNVTISSITGGGGTWVKCPNCHIFNPSGYSTDAWYNLSGNAGTYQGITVNLSGNAGSFLSVNFIEVLPPPGTTASYDDSGSSIQTGCTTCTSVTLNNITGTDAIIRNDGGSAPAQWNSWSAPYITDSNGYAIGLDVTSGAGPSVTYARLSNPEYMAIAFKSNAGIFAPPPHQYSIVNFSAFANNCSTCTLAIPTTGSPGHLLFIESGDEANTHITSVSGGGTWSVPTGPNTCQINFNISSQANANSCAYNLSVASGISSITVTMSGGAATNFAVWEIATTSGSFVLDTQASAINNTTSYYNSGPSLTLTGANDVVFQSEWCVGGSLGPTYYPQPYLNYVSSSFIGPGNYFLTNETSSVVLLDTGPTAPVPVWFNPQHDATFVSAVAFTAR